VAESNRIPPRIRVYKTRSSDRLVTLPYALRGSSARVGALSTTESYRMVSKSASSFGLTTMRCWPFVFNDIFIFRIS